MSEAKRHTGGPRMWTNEEYDRRLAAMPEGHEYRRVGDYRGSNEKVALLHLEEHGGCGLVWEATPNNVLNGGIRCAHCSDARSSLLSRAVEAALEGALAPMGLHAHREKSFLGLTSEKGKRLRFDFYVPELSLLIEVDGQQHFAVQNQHGDTPEKLALRMANDAKKDAFAAGRGWMLLRVRHTRKVAAAAAGVAEEVARRAAAVAVLGGAPGRVPRKVAVRPGTARGAQAKSQAQFVEEIRERVGDEYTVIGEYKNTDSPVTMRHNCEACGNYEWSVRAGSFLYRGNRCPECARLALKAPRTEVETVRARALQTHGEDYEIREFVNVNEPMTVLHRPCGTVYHPKYTNFFPASDGKSKAQFCPACQLRARALTIERVREIVAGRHGGAVVVVGPYAGRGSDPLPCRCARCGREWSPTLVNLRAGKGCSCKPRGRAAARLYSGGAAESTRRRAE